MNRLLFMLYLLLLIVGCDGGLSPAPPFRPGFGGTIYFAQGTWPSQDSVKGLWVFASEVYPIKADSVLVLYVAGKIQTYPALNSSLPFYIDSVAYDFGFENSEKLPITFAYIGVLHWVQGEVFPIDTTKYHIVGDYHEINSIAPKKITVKEFQYTPGINIYVDFYNLPPQLF